jgi:hypothetical protein
MNVGTVPYLSYNELSVADSDPFVTDPDPDFHFDTDIRILLFNLVRIRILAVSKN